MSIFFALIFITFLGGDLAWTLAARRAFMGDGSVRFARWGSYAFIGLMAGCVFLMIGGRLVGLRSDALFPSALLSAVMIWHFVGLAVALVVGAIVGVTKLVAIIARRRSEIVDAPEIVVSAGTPWHLQGETDARLVSRRELLARAAAFAPVAVTLATTATSQIELNRFRIRPIDVPIRGLLSALDGFTIAHVTDVHLGRFTTDATFRRIVAATNDLDCDLVLQTGDLINFDQRDLPVAAEMVHAMRGRYGQFMCEGNHDLIEGRETFTREARALRLPMLIDQGRTISINGAEVTILGLPWLRVPRGESVDAAYAPVVRRLKTLAPTNAFPILLAHHPHAFDAAVANGVPLTLAGHTHGGQLHLSENIGFGPLMYRYWSGLYQRDGASCVVSNGAGNWFPLRVNAPAEILRLTLRRA